MRRIRNFIEYLAAFIIIFLLLFAIASAVVIKYYGDEVKQYTMDLVNDQVDTKIYVKEMGISVFRKFPYTSVFFNDVTVWSGHGFNRNDFNTCPVDTLFTAEQIFIQFNLIDLVRKKYTIKSLEARNGVIQFFIDKQGAGNYNISNKKRETENTYLFDLKGVKIRDYDFRYLNHAKALDLSIELNDLDLEGNFSKINYQLDAAGSGTILSLNNHGIQYLSKQAIQTNVALQVQDNVYSISRGEVSLGELIADVNGEFLISQEGIADLNLKMTGRKVDISWLMDIVKKNGVSSLEGIDGNGKLNIDAEVTGLVSTTLSPHIQASFNTQNASVQVKDLPYPIKSLDFSASFNNGLRNSGSSSVLNVSSFNAKLAESEVFGSLAIQNFLLPRFTLSVNGDLNLGNVADLLPALPLSKVKGQAFPEIQVNGLITGLGEGMPGISFIPEGTIALSEAEFKLDKSDLRLSDINGTLDIENKRWSTSISGMLGSSDFALSGSSSNLLNYFLNDEKLDIDATLLSQNTDLNKLLDDLSDKQDTVQALRYPEDIDLRLGFEFGSITMKQVTARNAYGNIHYSFPSLVLDSLHAETMDGMLSGKLGLYNLHKETHLAAVTSTINSVKIDELFTSFNNFGQDFLTSKNIKGSVSGDAEFSALISKDFKMNGSDINLESIIIIDDGELNDFQPMIEMSRFLKLDKMDHIEFSTIQNTIMIKDNMITIPEMDIQSSALNLNASGAHSFDNTFNYHLAIKLSELLFKKAQGSANKEFEVALDENDHRTVFLLLYDEGDGMMIEFDEQQAMKKIREDMKNERSELKVVLHEEFGVFRNDEAVRKNANKEENPMFKFEFSEDETVDTLKTVEKEKRRWWNRKKENKKDLDFVIEHDL